MQLQVAVFRDAGRYPGGAPTCPHSAGLRPEDCSRTGRTPNNHGEGAYVYSFNKAGQTVQNPYAKNNAELLGCNDNDDMNTFTFIRYQKVDGEQVSDFGGDGHADVLGVDTGGNVLYCPNKDVVRDQCFALRDREMDLHLIEPGGVHG